MQGHDYGEKVPRADAPSKRTRNVEVKKLHGA